MKPEVVIQSSKPKSYAEVPVPPRILKRTDELPKKEIPKEDVDMKDDFHLNNSKPIMTNSGVPTSATTQPML